MHYGKFMALLYPSFYTPAFSFHIWESYFAIDTPIALTFLLILDAIKTKKKRRALRKIDGVTTELDATN